MNDSLAICIPTYNRSAIVDDALAYLIALVEQDEIPIYISDNASSDDTAATVARHQSRYPFIFYRRNSENLGVDANFEAVLRMASSEYAWLIGDDDRIDPKRFGEILALTRGPACDAILVNGTMREWADGRVLGLASTTYADANQLLVDIGWHTTWLSSMLVSRQLLAEMDFKQFSGSYFSHFGAFFTALGNRSTIKVCWKAESSYFQSAIAQSSWHDGIFEIFGRKWIAIVNALPQRYRADSKLACIRKHGVASGIFSVLNLMQLRARGSIDARKFSLFKSDLAVASPTPLWLISLICKTPVNALGVLRSAYVKLRRWGLVR